MTANVAGRRSSRLPVVLILLLMAIPLLAGGYRLGTLGELIEAVLDPSPARDEQLKETASGDASDVLNQIRALVCA